MKRREFQVAFASFIITALLIAGVWGLISVDIHSRRYGVGVSTPVISVQFEGPFQLQMAIFGHEQVLSLESINQLQGLVRKGYSFIPRPFRLTQAFYTQGRMAYEQYQAIQREREFKEQLLADGF